MKQGETAAEVVIMKDGELYSKVSLVKFSVLEFWSFIVVATL